mmetsp:Transcript_15258/g.27733  ORF Transcript_15258/g.27733 Transcript_15258/m.27733 type:complete len:363 (-) Transcript_15258:5-1093(-)
MSNQGQVSPDTKKKKPALPSLLSNLRNAQAVIDRAADDWHERETRPLVGGGGSRMAASTNHPQLHRSAPSSSFSSVLHNFSQRFGSQWRKRPPTHLSSSSRRKKGHGVTIVPQSFFLAVGCFFVAFPVFFVVYILARHAVFGDEGDNSGAQVHIHEVPSAFAGMAFESGEELLERNKIDHLEDGIEGAGEIGENQSSSSEGVAIGSQMIEEEDPPGLIESATSDLPSDVKHDLLGETNLDQTIGDIILDQSDSISESIVETKIDGSMKEDNTENIHNATGGRDENIILAPKEIKSSNDSKDDKYNLEQASKSSGSSDVLSTSIRKESVKSDSSSDQVKKEGDTSIEKEVYQNNLRGSQDENK